jgi:hypothetical protein
MDIQKNANTIITINEKSITYVEVRGENLTFELISKRQIATKNKDYNLDGLLGQGFMKLGSDYVNTVLVETEIKQGNDLLVTFANGLFVPFRDVNDKVVKAKGVTKKRRSKGVVKD